VSTSSLSRLGEMLLTTFGLGRLRPAPGTWGSMPPVVLAAMLIAAGMGPNQTFVNWATYNGALAVVLLVFSAACVRYGTAAEAKFGKKDPGTICADETAGMCLPLMMLPSFSVATPGSAAMTLGIAFIAFRVFDIVKLWPANGLQRHPAGWGVLLDDLAAGVQAAVVVQVVVRVM
jgi:phosphatidylglycerophosphatase A